MPVGDFKPIPKPKHKRGKPTRRRRSELPKNEVVRLRIRSGGVCEKCDRRRATGKAHVERRWHSERIPTAEDCIDLCDECHAWCDGSQEGRHWLVRKQKELRAKAL